MGNYNLEEYMNLFLWMEDQKLMGNDPFLALVAEDNKVETLKEAVKAQEKLKLRSGLRMMTQKKNQVMRRRRTERMKMTRAES